MILFFGASLRGESAKTGRNQGVRLDYPHSVERLRSRLRTASSPSDRVFPIKLEQYRKWWDWAAARAGVSESPHSCRHTGASHDLASGYRTQQQVMRRGRWLADKSIARYAQTHKWVAAIARQNKAVRARGAAILRGRRPRARKATE